MTEHETLRYSDYFITPVRKSRIIPGIYVIDKAAAVLFCPRCRAQGAGIEHGHTRTCECGLVMTVWGNYLEISV